MACWACNPYCGRCKPPMDRPIQCPVCQKYNFPQISKKDYCVKCGAILPKREQKKTVLCTYSGMLCANPCLRHTLPPKDNILMRCRMNTPPERLS